MLANINLIEQNKIEVPKEVQFYIKKREQSLSEAKFAGYCSK
jgi:hypothetical protein